MRYIRRFTEDKLVNNNGRLLLDFCKGLDLHIVNGRVGNDLGRGKLTCKNTSTIDYVIASPNCFQLIKDFDVDIFDSFLSDVHSPLRFTLVHMSDKNETADVEINLPILPATDEAICITKWDTMLATRATSHKLKLTYMLKMYVIYIYFLQNYVVWKKHTGRIRLQKLKKYTLISRGLIKSVQNLVPNILELRKD